MQVLHVVDHSIPLPSGYTFRTCSILREQRTLGWGSFHVTSSNQAIYGRLVERPLNSSVESQAA